MNKNQFNFGGIVFLVIQLTIIGNLSFYFLGTENQVINLITVALFSVISLYYYLLDPKYFLFITFFFYWDSFGFIHEQVGAISGIFKPKDVFFILSIVLMGSKFFVSYSSNLLKSVKFFSFLILIYLLYSSLIYGENILLALRASRSFCPIILTFLFIKLFDNYTNIRVLLNSIIFFSILGGGIYTVQGISGIQIFPSYFQTYSLSGSSFIRGYAGFPIFSITIFISSMILLIEKNKQYNQRIVIVLFSLMGIVIILSLTRSIWSIAVFQMFIVFFISGSLIDKKGYNSIAKSTRKLTITIFLLISTTLIFFLFPKILIPVNERINEFQSELLKISSKSNIFVSEYSENGVIGYEGSFLTRAMFIYNRTQVALNFNPLIGIGFIHDESSLLSKFNIQIFGPTTRGFFSTDVGLSEILSKGLIFSISWLFMIFFFFKQSIKDFNNSVDPEERLWLISAIFCLMYEIIRLVISQQPIQNFGATFSLCFGIVSIIHIHHNQMRNI